MAYGSIRSNSTIEQVRDYKTPFIECKPNFYPTVTILKAKGGPKMISEKTEWGEKDFIQMETKINHAAYTTETDLIVDSTAGMYQGCKIFVPRTKEYIYCGDVTSSTRIGGVTPCTRGALGTSAAGGLTDDETLIIMGAPLKEGFYFSDVPTFSNPPNDIYNYPETFGVKVGITGRQQRIQKNGGIAYGDTYETDILEAIEHCKRNMNRAALFGIRHATGSGRDRVTNTGGIIQYAYWQDSTAKSITNRITFENMFKDVLNVTSGDLWVATDYYGMQLIQGLYQGANLGSLNNVILEKVGVKIKEVETVDGATIHFYKDASITGYNIDGSPDAMRGMMIGYSLDAFEMAELSPIGEYNISENNKTGDFDETMVMAEVAFRCLGAKHFCVFDNLIKAV